MDIVMSGIDYKHSELSIREKFALTKEKTTQLLEIYKENPSVGGVVVISTCNRTEIYLSVEEISNVSIPEIVCEALGLDFGLYNQYFFTRKNQSAFLQLCRVASGLDSQILGDDQIITQVRESLELARTCAATDSYLETMFNVAIQAAKAIKTQIPYRENKASSVPFQAVEMLKEQIYLSGKQILVIGNGQMGRLVAELLVKENANVTMTIRQYKKGIVKIPKGVCAISYEERYNAIAYADVVVSATLSPHFTLNFEQMESLCKIPELIIDLAVPRDVDPLIQGLGGTNVITVDDLPGTSGVIASEMLSQIESIVQKHSKKFSDWCSYKQKIIAVGKQAQ